MSAIEAGQAEPVEKQRQKLARLLNDKDEQRPPHHINRRLNKLERENGYDHLLSYPIMVTLQLANKCNAQCLFCSYRHNRALPRHNLSAENVRAMSWLRYASKLALHSGDSESMTNPAFGDIYQTIREQYGHLKTNINTNATLMSDRLCELFADHMETLVVSTHAATAETWSRVFQMPARHFDIVAAQIRKLIALRTNGSPRVVLAFVINGHNVHEIAAFVEHAARIGADAIQYVGVITSHIKDADLRNGLVLNAETKALVDRQMIEADRLGALHGIEIKRPALFGESGSGEKFVIKKGLRQPVGADYTGATTFLGCYDPWIKLQFTAGNKAGACCKGAVFDYYDVNQLDPANFQAIWNSETARMFRRTVNVNGGNAICTICQSRAIDDADDGLEYLDPRAQHLRRLQEAFAARHGRPPSHVFGDVFGTGQGKPAEAAAGLK